MYTDTDQLILKKISTGDSVSSVLGYIRQSCHKGYSLIHDGYALPCFFIDMIPSFSRRLELIYGVVKLPTFKYVPSENPDNFVRLLAISSYWLDSELFNSTPLYTKRTNAVAPTQRLHLKFLDIGVTLIKKGFSFSDDVLQISDSIPRTVLYPYAKTYLDQCRKRFDFFDQNKQNNLFSTALKKSTAPYIRS